MTRHLAGLICAAGLFGQEAAAPGIVRGTLVQAEGGHLDIRQASGVVVRCGFDTRTWIERDHKKAQMDALETGLSVEAVTDTRMGRCYTRTVRLGIVITAPLTAARRTLPTPPRTSALDSIFPRGNLTFAGVVIRRSPTLLVLRTRTEPEKMVKIRQDTRFLADGLPASAADVAVNTRVFVRGGKNFENDLEAFQVIWGQIEGPR
jgi:hypothetical protein